MKVADLCICDVAAVGPQASLTRAGSLMRKYNVGSIPVIDRNDRPIGMITDRDIAVALTQRNALPSEVLVDEVMTEGVAVCDLEDDVREVLRILGREQVRRLPVVDDRGQLEGIISIDDIICHAVDVDGGRELPYDIVVETLCRIAQPYRAETGPARASER
jgi:CBS domain-containing protein